MVKKQINVVYLSDVKPIDDNIQEDVKNEDDERTIIKEAIEQEEKQEESKHKPKRKTPTKKTKVQEEEQPPIELSSKVEPEKHLRSVKENKLKERQEKISKLIFKIV